MSRLSCVHQTFLRSCTDFHAFTRLSCVHVQTFVRSPDFRAFIAFFLEKSRKVLNSFLSAGLGVLVELKKMNIKLELADFEGKMCGTIKLV